MSGLREIALNILLGVVAGIVTTILQVAWSRWIARKFARKTWQLGGNANDLEVCVSVTKVFDQADTTRSSPRLAVGLGPMRALPILAPSLVRGYPGIEISNIPVDPQRYA